MIIPGAEGYLLCHHTDYHYTYYHYTYYHHTYYHYTYYHYTHTLPLLFHR